MEGLQIGSYRIERKLGEGGMGVVWIGVDVRLGRRAAIKQLLPELTGNRDIVERFFNEAKAAASINHPGIVEIYDVGWHSDGSAFFAMKLLEGDSLAKRLRAGGPMPAMVAATIARQVASALNAAHARGIVHRDLKPDNVVLVADDEVSIGERATVLDFGIAKLFGDHAVATKTRTGSVMGTPYYMSPEQCRGAGEVDHRTDVYALGCIMFEMLTGRPPFEAEGVGELLGLHQFVEPPTVRSLRPDVPPELEVVVMRTLAKRPDQRFQSMTELTAALQPFATARSMEHAAPRAQHSAGFAAQAAASAPAMPAVAAMPSTLSAGRGQVGQRTGGGRPSRRGLMIALVGLGLAGAVAAVVVIAAGGDDRGSTSGAGGTPLASLEHDAAAAPSLPVAVDAAEPPAVIVDAAEAAVVAPVDASVAPVASTDAGVDDDARHARFLAEKKQQALALARAHKCKELRRLAVDAGKVSADAKAVVTAVPCEEAKAAVDAATPATGKSADELLTEATAAAQTSQWGRALSLAEQALRARPDSAGAARAAMIAALAACNLKNAAKARQYHPRASPTAQTAIRQRCAQNGVSIE